MGGCNINEVVNTSTYKIKKKSKRLLGVGVDSIVQQRTPSFARGIILLKGDIKWLNVQKVAAQMS